VGVPTIRTSYINAHGRPLSFPLIRLPFRASSICQIASGIIRALLGNARAELFGRSYLTLTRLFLSPRDSNYVLTSLPLNV
jgi:hypothetical protein